MRARAGGGPRNRARRALVAVSIVAVLAVVAILIASRPTGMAVEPYDGPLPHFAVPRGYHVSYHVTARSSSSTQEAFVRRPFSSYEEDIAHGESDRVTAMRLGTEVFRSKTGPATLLHTAFSPSRRDVRIDAVARAAIEAGRLRLVGRAQVLDTICYILRSAAPLTSGPLLPLTRGDHVDSCVDDRGLVLDERTVKSGRVVTERTATHVAVGWNAAKANYDLAGQSLPVDRGGGAMHALTLDSRPSSGPFWDISRPPAGFKHTGRFAVVPSQPQAFADKDPTSRNALGMPGSLVATIDDTYVHGADAIVIEQGSTVNDAKFEPPTGGVKVNLGRVLGSGQLLLSASASEVDAEPHEGRRFIRVVGTLPPDELIAIARSLTLQPAGTMRRA